jgi:hypothetical protein
LTVRGENAEVAIGDLGPGVPAEHIERIFERYFSYRPNPHAAAEASSHFGVGLWIARRNVEALGGFITVENRAPNGLLVGITLGLAGRRSLTAARPSHTDRKSLRARLVARSRALTPRARPAVSPAASLRRSSFGASSRAAAMIAVISVLGGAALAMYGTPRMDAMFAAASDLAKYRADSHEFGVAPAAISPTASVIVSKAPEQRLDHVATATGLDVNSEDAKIRYLAKRAPVQVQPYVPPSTTTGAQGEASTSAPEMISKGSAVEPAAKITDGAPGARNDILSQGKTALIAAPDSTTHLDSIVASSSNGLGSVPSSRSVGGDNRAEQIAAFLAERLPVPDRGAETSSASHATTSVGSGNGERRTGQATDEGAMGRNTKKEIAAFLAQRLAPSTEAAEWVTTSDGAKVVSGRDEPHLTRQALDGAMTSSGATTQIVERYAVQVASFLDESAARRLADTLVAQGITVSLPRTSDRDGRVWFIVRSREFETVEEANRTLQLIPSIVGITPVVRHWRRPEPVGPHIDPERR